MRVDLRDGQWAELRERISHAADKEIKKLGVRSLKPDGDDEKFDWQTLLVAKFLRSWNVLDVDGVPIPAEDPSPVEKMPGDIVDVLFDKATDLYAEIRDPNPPTPPSSDS